MQQRLIPLRKIFQAIHGAIVWNIIIMSEELSENKLPRRRVSMPRGSVVFNYITARIADDMPVTSDIWIFHKQKSTFTPKVTPDNSYNFILISLIDVRIYTFNLL